MNRYFLLKISQKLKYFNDYLGYLHLKKHCLHSELHPKGVKHLHFSRTMPDNSASLSYNQIILYVMVSIKNLNKLTHLIITIVHSFWHYLQSFIFNQ